jgi:tetratricopeptide (TPR) repeat protein
MQEFNVLAKPGECLKADPRAIEVQRVYLQGAREYAASQKKLPLWFPRLLADWEAALHAMEEQNNVWLAARLDAWTKHALFSQVLSSEGYSWKDLLNVSNLFEELALLDQNYHEFSNLQSVFHLLEQQKLLKHRVADPLPPGGEPDPYVPDTATRARTRAQFIRSNAGKRNLVIDWAWVSDRNERHCSQLPQPFSQEYGPWEAELPETTLFETLSRRHLCPSPESLERQIDQQYQRGAYHVAHEHLLFLERLFRRTPATARPNMLRYRAWLQSRRGYTDGIQYLDALYHDQPINLAIAGDYVFVYRFRSLDLPPEAQPWLERGRELLEQAQAAEQDSGDALAFREHLGYALLHEEKYGEALRVLEPFWHLRNRLSSALRIQGRALATLGNAYRLTGRQRKARICLNRAEHILNEHGFTGDLADFAWTGLAKQERSTMEALERLNHAQHIQKELGSPIGLARTILIKARHCSNIRQAANCKNEIIELRGSVPGLQNCRLLERILTHWQQWISEPSAGSQTDTYWGV